MRAIILNTTFRTAAPLVALALVVAPASAADPNPGQAIYAKQCAKCHGANGEGTKKFPHALTGTKTIGPLSKVVQETMPEDNPGSLSDKDAEAVAAYMFHAFYSPAAQARNNPARVELARLTVNQYRNAVADAIGAFRPAAPKWGDQRGLAAEYYKNRRFRPTDRAVERLDPQVKFDFGKDSPAPGKIEANEFSIRWSGSVLAPETGPYEFVVRTDHAARLWVNDLDAPLIDRWVKSGTDTEFTAQIFLVGGRAYPLRMEFSKAKQGVDDSKKKGPPPLVPAFVQLAWKPPQGVVEPIPARHLSPAKFPELYVVSNPFPPDDRSYGWERGTTVSKAWDQATTDAALDAAAYVATDLDDLAGVAAKDRAPREASGNPAGITFDGKPMVNPTERDKKAREFARKFVERAFRRPLTAEQAAVYVDRHFASAKTADEAVKRVVILALKSPRLLYREAGRAADAYDVAARLSFALWDSVPDDVLLKAAAANQLATREQVTKQAERMLTDLRAKRKLRGFYHHWLKVDEAVNVTKDAKQFPGFDAAAVADLRASLDLFLDDVTWGDRPDFRRLLTAEEVYLNDRLAKLYGVTEAAGADFRKVPLDAGKRAGVLTHPFLMAKFAYTSETSPIHRGVFLARGVLGVGLRPPADAFTPLSPDLHPTLTTRERVTLQTKGAACMTCHEVINPLGFTLENFDAIGRYRTTDNKKPVDAAGGYQTKGGKDVKFTGPRELAAFLAASEEVQASFAQQMFHHLVQQSVRAFGANRVDELRAGFAATGFDVRKLAVEIAASAALAGKEPPKPIAVLTPAAGR